MADSYHKDISTIIDEFYNKLNKETKDKKWRN